MPFERSIGRAILRGLAPEALSLGQMIDIARRAGGGYRYQDMLNDARSFTGRLKYESQVRSLTSNQVVPRGWMSEVSLPRPYRYRVHGEVELFDETTGERFTQKSSFYTNNLSKLQDYENDFYTYYEGSYAEQDFSIMSFKATALEHQAGWSY